MRHSVTEEVVAGACGLDGEALTHELLLENERLLAENARLKRQNNRAFWMWIITTFVYVTLLIHAAFSMQKSL